MDALARFTMQGMELLSTLFVMAVGIFVLVMLYMFVVDIRQTKDSIRHNFPVLGRFRSLFSFMGEFFRQYFFAMDREEMPFNRAEREWVYKSSEGVDNTVAFGSTRNLMQVGTPIFVPTVFPKLDEESAPPSPITFGPYTPNPYETNALINVSAMSYGALSKPAIRALSKGAKLSKCWLNTGEGGLASYHLEGDCDIVFQIGTAKFGVRDEAGQLSAERLKKVADIPNVKMIEIKLSQGAKPGKGGILPAAKVNKEISEIRGIPLGEAAISPNRHKEIKSPNGLLDYISVVRDISGLPTGFKTVIGTTAWLHDFCQLIKERGPQSAPDFITIDSGDGGTGAAPMPLMDNVGVSIKESLPHVIDILVQYGLRDRVKVIATGKLITPAEVAWAYCAGADTVCSARGYMFALGCIQALKCNKNTCPTGITTHKKRLQEGLDPEEKAVRVKNFVGKIHYGTGLIAHSCGVKHPRELTRDHCRIMLDKGQSMLLSELYPGR